MQKNIKNLIFDVGNVLLEYRWHDMLMDYGLSAKEANDVGDQIFDNNLWSAMDLGTMETDEIIEAYAKLYPNYADLIRWFITHGELMHVKREDVWKRVHELKEKGYHIYLLSNYSKDLFELHTSEASFMQDIDGKVVSYQIHIGKPDAAIYQYLLDTYELKPQESVFFDDREENTAAAERMGIKSYTITSKEYLLQVLEEF